MEESKRTSVTLILSVLVSLYGTSALLAQEDNPRFEHLSLAEGLSQGTVQSILQDHKGFMWFATLDGLNKYDGYSFVVYRPNPADPHSLSDSDIRTIYEDRAGVLWVGTFNGLNRLDRATGRFTRYWHDPDDPQSLSHNTVWSIYEDQASTLWIGTDGGLNRLDRVTGRFTRYLHDPNDPQSLSHNAVWSIYEDQAGALWIGTDGGLNRLDRATGRFTRYLHDPNVPQSLSHDEVRAIDEDQTGAIWVGTFNGLNRLERATGRFTRYWHDPNDPESLGHNTVWSIYKDRGGALWIGTDGGLNRLERTTGRFIRYRHNPNDPQSLNDNRVWSIYESRTGILWVGTNGGGINKLDRTRKPFVHFRHDPDDPNSLSNNSLRAFYQDRSGILWIGTDGGLNRLDRKTGRFTHYRHDADDPHSLSHDSVRAVFQDRSGVFWVGTLGGGLNRFDPESGRFTAYRHDPDDPESLSDDRIRAIHQDEAGTFWIGTYGGGLNQFDPQSGRFTPYRHDADDPESLSDNRVTLVYEDLSGTLWIGTAGGLNRFDPRSGRFTPYRHDPDGPQSLSHNVISSIHQDQAGALWIGTYGGGLNRFDPESGQFIHFRERDGLPNEVIYGILEDDSGNLWLSSNKGLSRFNPATGDGPAFRNFDIHDGLQSNEFNANVCYKSASGEMFFGGMNGFNAFYPDRIKDNRHVPPVVLTVFKIFNEPVTAGTFHSRSNRPSPLQKHISETSEIQLSYRENVVSFEFVALNYSSPEKNQYAYKMEGFDEDWVSSGTKHDATYTNLGPGTYLFRVKGSNNDGVWNEEGTSVRLIISPPFWATWWFRLSTISALVGLAFVGYRRRISKLDAAKHKLEQLVAERTSALSAANEQLTEEIHERRRSAYALSQSEARFRSVSESANDAIISADSQGRIVFWNKRAEMDFGYTAEEVLGRPLTILMPERYREAHEKGLQRMATAGRSNVIGKVFEVDGLRKDGSEFPLELSLASWKAAEGIFFSGMIRDITRRKQAQEKLQEMQNRLIVQEKMASLGSLVAGVAHEMNSPIGVIHSMNDTSVHALDKLKSTLEQSTPAESEGRQTLQSLFDALADAHRFIASGTERVTRILGSLRNFARLDEAEFQLTDLHEGIESSLTLLQSQLHDGITVLKDYGDLVPVYCSPGQLNQVIMHVLKNALLAIENTGTITIKTYQDQDRTYIRISDTGVGIQREQLDRLFDFSFNEKTDRVKMRLGMATSYHIIQAHQGEMDVASEVGRGTVVTISLPRRTRA